MKRNYSFALALVLIPAALGQATQVPLGAASGFNVFVFNDFSEYNTDAQGKVAVGGNFAPSGNGGFTVAATSHDGAGVFDLIVAGNYTNNGTQLGGGDAYVGGNMNWTDPSIPHNAYVAGNFTNNSSGGSVGGTVYYAGSYSSGDSLNHVKTSASSMPAPINFASAETSLDALSSALAGEQANGSVSHTHSTYTLTGTDASLNVFDLTASSYSGATININAPSTSTVVINVAGSADSFVNGSINLNGLSADNVIFNFNSASTLLLSGIAFNGTILAPNAAFTGNWGQLNGELIADSATGTTQFNDFAFTGNLGSAGGGNTLPASTPEPSTWLLLAGGCLAIVGWAKKRRNRE
jgi:choice-of-anchor A domain-containing protein